MKRPSLRRLGSARPALLPEAFLFAAIAVAVTVLPARGLVVADARYEHVADPWQFLQRHATIWDDERGPGQTAVYFSPVVSAFQSIVHGLGAAPWLVGRLTLALYLAVAATGACALARRLGLTRPFAVVAGLLFAFNPFASQFLTPSGLYVPAAILPWLMLCLLEGVRREVATRAAACFALAVFAVGALNTASLIYVLLPVVVIGASLVAVERQVSWRRVWAFAWRAGGLTLGISAAMLVVQWWALPVVRQNLLTTELPRTVARTSSSSESWRGLGLWTTYFQEDGVELRSQARAYFSSPWIIAATYVVPLLALVGVVASRVRLRRSWAVLLVVAVALMIGAHRPDASPLAWLHAKVLDEVVGARALRSAYKAGPGAQLAMALLAAGVLLPVWHRARTAIVAPTVRRWAATGGALALGAVLVASAFPFVTGRLYSTNDTFRDVPSYWADAFDFFDDRPLDERVLVLPGVTRARYEWGYVNDNLFDAHLRPQALMAQTLTSTTPELAVMIESVDRAFAAGELQPDAVAPALRWLGARWVVVQNDLARRTDLPTPDRFDVLDRAPGVVLAARFGPLGAAGAAVEVYEVLDPPAPAALSTTPPTIVSGGPDAVGPLAAEGWLDGPTTLLSQLSDERLRDLVDAGAPVVVTDGGRRRAVRATTSRAVLSATLDAGAAPGRPIDALSTDTATQTVAEYGALQRVFSSRDGRADDVSAPSGRPALAFDDDESTGWTASGLLVDPVGAALEVRFAHPERVEELELEELVPLGRRITGLRLELLAREVPEQPVQEITPDPSGPTLVRIGDEITGFRLTITSVVAGAGPTGLAEVAIRTDDGILDTREVLRAPTDVDRVAGTGAPVSYAFGRSGAVADEPALRRRFDVVAAESVTVRATLRDVDPAVFGPLGRACVEVFRLDAGPIAVRLVPGAAAGDGAALEVEGCEVVDLVEGTHGLEESAPFRGRTVVVGLAAAGLGREAPPSPVPSTRVGRTGYELDLPATGGYLRAPAPAHRGWELDAERSLRPLVINGDQGWELGAGAPTRASLSFRPQSVYQLAVMTTAGFVALCVALAVGRRR